MELVLLAQLEQPLVLPPMSLLHAQPMVGINLTSQLPLLDVHNVTLLLLLHAKAQF
jgi:hypothetical protein